MKSKGSLYHCRVCLKDYIKSKSHATCYKKFCWICDLHFDNRENQAEHSKEFHPEHFCEQCGECIQNLEAHKLHKKEFCKKY